jgi:ABC-type Fe3+-siderophore transport system permease subunit
MVLISIIDIKIIYHFDNIQKVTELVIWFTGSLYFRRWESCSRGGLAASPLNAHD